MKRFAFVVALLMLIGLPLAVAAEIVLRIHVFSPWAEVNIVGNPDHRMTPALHEDVNSDGIRENVEASAYVQQDFNVVILGDSFTYGWQLEPEQSFPNQLEGIARAAGYSRVHTANFGWLSSSPLLSKRLLEDIGRKYKPDLVLLALDMTDVFDDQLYENVLERRGIFGIGQVAPGITMAISKVNQRLGQSDFVAQLLFGVPGRRFFIVEHPLEQTRSSFDHTTTIIDGIRTYSRDTLGAKFALFVLPRHFQYDAKLCKHNWEKDQYPLLGPHVLEPFRYYAELAKRRDYPVVSLLPEFQRTKVFPTTFDDDPHYNEAGARIVADAILDHLEQIPGILPAKHETGPDP